VQLQEKDILKKVYGTVAPGQTLAIMGASGKTRILNIVAYIDIIIWEAELNSCNTHTKTVSQSCPLLHFL